MGEVVKPDDPPINPVELRWLAGEMIRRRRGEPAYWRSEAEYDQHLKPLRTLTLLDRLDTAERVVEAGHVVIQRHRLSLRTGRMSLTAKEIAAGE